MVRRGERTPIKGSGRKGDAIDIDAFSEDEGKKVEGRGFEGDYIYISTWLKRMMRGRKRRMKTRMRMRMIGGSLSNNII